MKEEDSIFHSNRYLGETFEEKDGDSIRHWKYIKKEKKNGYTRYYYKDDDLAEAKKRYDTDKEAIEYENQKRMYGQIDMTHQVHRGKVVDDPTYNKLADDVVTSSLNYRIKKSSSEQRKKKYEPIIKALNEVSLFNSKIKKKINRGKKALAKLFK